MKKLLKKFIPNFLINWYHLGLAFLGAFLYGFPFKKIDNNRDNGHKGQINGC